MLIRRVFRSLTTYIPPKHLSLHPVHTDKHSIPRTETHIQIRTLPEEISHRATTRKIATQPAYVCHRLLAANVRQTTLVTVFKRSDLLDATELLLQHFHLCEDLVAVVRFGGSLSLGEDGEFVVDGIGFGERVEESSKKSTFLRCYLRSRCVIGYSAVADGPDCAQELVLNLLC